MAAVFFIILTIPLARFTDHLIRQRERRERAAGACELDELPLRHARERHEALR